MILIRQHRRTVAILLVVWTIFSILYLHFEIQRRKSNLSFDIDILTQEVFTCESEAEVQMADFKFISGELPEPFSIRDRIDSYIYEISNKYNFDRFIIHSVIWHESRYDVKARNTIHLGLMQISTKWHSERAATLGVYDFYDPYGNILLGVDYLSELYETTGDMALTLMLYNMGHTRAKELYDRGEISYYARSVLARADELRKGVIN